LSLEQKKRSKIHKECLHKFFSFGIFTTNTLSTNVHKIYECDKIQVLYKCNVKIFKKWNFKKIRPLIEHGPHWINFIIFTCISEKRNILETYIKFETKLLFFTWEKRGNLRQIVRKMKKKVNLKVFRVSPYVSKGVPQSWPSTFILAFSNKMEVEVTYISNVTN
jgi:hypothetical protein